MTSDRSNAPEGWWREFLLAEARPAKIAVVSASGAPLVAPVWIALDGDEIVFTTNEATAKGKALRRDSRVALCVDDERPPFAYVIVHGTATISEDPDDLLHWATVLGGRYMGADRAEEYGRRNGVPGELLVRVTPAKVLAEQGVAD